MEPTAQTMPGAPLLPAVLAVGPPPLARNIVNIDVWCKWDPLLSWWWLPTCSLGHAGPHPRGAVRDPRHQQITREPPARPFL